MKVTTLDLAFDNILRMFFESQIITVASKDEVSVEFYAGSTIKSQCRKYFFSFDGNVSCLDLCIGGIFTKNVHTINHNLPTTLC